MIFPVWKTVGLSSQRTKFLSRPQSDKYLNSLSYLPVSLNLNLLKKLKSNFFSFRAAVQCFILESSWKSIPWWST